MNGDTHFVRSKWRENRGWSANCLNEQAHDYLSSRGTTERILISFRRREKSRFFVKAANWPPL